MHSIRLRIKNFDNSTFERSKRWECKINKHKSKNQMIKIIYKINTNHLKRNRIIIFRIHYLIYLEYLVLQLWLCIFIYLNIENLISQKLLENKQTNMKRSGSKKIKTEKIIQLLNFKISKHLVYFGLLFFKLH